MQVEIRKREKAAGKYEEVSYIVLSLLPIYVSALSQ